MNTVVRSGPSTVARSAVRPGQFFVTETAWNRNAGQATVYMAMSDNDDEIRRVTGRSWGGPPPYLSVNVATGNLAISNNDAGTTRVFIVEPENPVTFSLS